MYHEGKSLTCSALYPVIGTSFTTESNINIKGQGTLEYGVKYIISGVGFSKPDDSGERRQLWVVINKYNAEQPPVHIWRDDLNKLYDKKIITVLE
jgi:hypothetical protein